MKFSKYSEGEKKKPIGYYMVLTVQLFLHLEMPGPMVIFYSDVCACHLGNKARTLLALNSSLQGGLALGSSLKRGLNALFPWRNHPCPLLTSQSSRV